MKKKGKKARKSSPAVVGLLLQIIPAALQAGRKYVEAQLELQRRQTVLLEKVGPTLDAIPSLLELVAKAGRHSEEQMESDVEEKGELHALRVRKAAAEAARAEAEARRESAEAAKAEAEAQRERAEFAFEEEKRAEQRAKRERVQG